MTGGRRGGSSTSRSSATDGEPRSGRGATWSDRGAVVRHAPPDRHSCRSPRGGATTCTRTDRPAVVRGRPSRFARVRGHELESMRRRPGALPARVRPRPSLMARVTAALARTRPRRLARRPARCPRGRVRPRSGSGCRSKPMRRDHGDAHICARRLHPPHSAALANARAHHAAFSGPNGRTSAHPSPIWAALTGPDG